MKRHLRLEFEIGKIFDKDWFITEKSKSSIEYVDISYEASMGDLQKEMSRRYEEHPYAQEVACDYYRLKVYQDGLFLMGINGKEEF